MNAAFVDEALGLREHVGALELQVAELNTELAQAHDQVKALGDSLDQANRDRDEARADFEVANAGLEMAAAACVSRDLVQQALDVLTTVKADAFTPAQRLRSAEKLLGKALRR